MLDLAAWLIGIAGIVTAVLLLAVTVWSLLSGYDLNLDEQDLDSSTDSVTDVLRSTLSDQEWGRLLRDTHNRQVSVQQRVAQIVQGYLRAKEVTDSEIQFRQAESTDLAVSEGFGQVMWGQQTKDVKSQSMAEYDERQGAIDELALHQRRE
jgi:hypothetical protein